MMKLSRVEILRESVKQVVSMLTRKKVAVSQVGMQAFVRYDRRGEPDLVNLPALPNDASDDLINATQGFLDHEVAHIIFTDYKILQKASKTPLGMFHNVLEDIYIEKAMKRAYKGSAKNLTNVWSFLQQRLIGPRYEAMKDKASVEDLQGLLTPAMFRAWSGCPIAGAFMKDKEHIFAPLRKAIGEDLIEKIAKMDSTKDSFELTVAIFNRMQEYKKRKEEEEEKKRQEEEQKAAEKQKQQSAPPPNVNPHPDDESSGEDEEDAPEGEGSEQQSEEQGDGAGESEQSDGSGGDEENDESEDDGESDEGSDEAGESESESDEESEDGAESDEESEDGAEGDESDESEDEADEESDAAAGGDADESEESDEEQDDEESDEAAGAGDESDEESDEEEESEETDGAGDGDGEDEDDTDESDGKDEAAGAANDAPSEDQAEQGEDAPQVQEDDGDGENGAGSSQEIAASMDALQNKLKDMSKDMADEIAKMARSSLQGGSYCPLTRDADKIERFKTVDHPENDRLVRELEERTGKMAGSIQKRLERAIQAKSYARKIPGFRAGKLHSSSLHRLRTGNDRVFRRKFETKTKDVAVQLVVDMSGSMAGGKLQVAMQAAYAMSSVLDRMLVKNEVIGFTTTRDERLLTEHLAKAQEIKESSGVVPSRWDVIIMPVVKEFDERLSNERKLAFAQVPHFVPQGANIDGESLEYANRRLQSRQEARKIMIVLSDGFPAGCGDGSMLASHLRETVRKIMQNGTDVFGIGIEDEAVQDFYPLSEVLYNLDDLPTKVLGTMEKLLFKQ